MISFFKRENLAKEKMQSPTFCVYPWIHQMTTPSGKVNFCCISEKTHVTNAEGQAYSLEKDSFSDAWNAKYMKVIRQKMLSGETVTGCETCYQQEKIGKRSYRQTHNEEWINRLGARDVEARVEHSLKNDYTVNTPPVYLDLRLGNLCNLKCRMCNPYNSVMIHKEWTELDRESNGSYSEFWKKYQYQNGNFDKWYESDNFWNDVEKYIPHLKKVYMTGGEPTLINGNYRFLELCKKTGYASKIELFFNLNFTNMSDNFIEQLSHFKWTSINASLDGFAGVNEYIRGSSRWDVCDRNINRLLSANLKNLGLGFSPVIQSYNILNITGLLDYAWELSTKYNHDILVDFLYCFSPEFLDFEYLPAKIKVVALQRLTDWAQSAPILKRKSDRSFFVKDGVSSLINRLTTSMDKEDPEKIRDFLFYTKTLDAKRKQQLSNSLPELAGLLNECGYTTEIQ